MNDIAIRVCLVKWRLLGYRTFPIAPASSALLNAQQIEAAAVIKLLFAVNRVILGLERPEGGI